MDPKLLQILRAMLGVDAQLLPDSMTPDEFGTFIEKEKGKLFGNPEDYKKLQKIISQKDVDLKKTASDLKELSDKKIVKNPKESKLKKLLETQGEQLKKVEKELKQINRAKESEQLKKTYPDILPELLIGKKEEQREKIVEKQRTLNKKLYGDAKHFTQPKYNDAEEIQKEIDLVKDDKTISSEGKAVKVLQLEREKENFKPTPEG